MKQNQNVFHGVNKDAKYAKKNINVIFVIPARAGMAVKESLAGSGFIPDRHLYRNKVCLVSTRWGIKPCEKICAVNPN